MFGSYSDAIPKEGTTLQRSHLLPMDDINDWTRLIDVSRLAEWYESKWLWGVVTLGVIVGFIFGAFFQDSIKSACTRKSPPPSPTAAPATADVD